MKNFKEFIDIKKQLDTNEHYCILEERPYKYMFGTNNYGEICDTINSADGDPWDVIIPGYQKLDINIQLKIKKLEGLIEMPNGNHKLIIDIFTEIPRLPPKQIKNEIYSYRRLYNKVCRKRGTVLFFKDKPYQDNMLDNLQNQ